MCDRLKRVPWVYVVVILVAAGALIRGSSKAWLWVALILFNVTAAALWFVRERSRERDV